MSLLFALIRSFKDEDAKLLWETGKSRRIPASIRTSAVKKLTILNWATSLRDLTAPAGYRLESLGGDRVGQHSIRINDEYQICFRWQNGNAENVEIVDYH